jgi:gamma-glutamylcyclotransferase
MKIYFAYGANLSLDSMSWRCPDAEPVTAFYLRDWRLELHCHATIRPSAGDCVAGALWSITPDCEASLDAFEGYPVYYHKQIVQQDGIEFMVYVMNEPLSGRPGSSYVNLLAEGYQDWQLPLPALLQAVSGYRDPIAC